MLDELKAKAINWDEEYDSVAYPDNLASLLLDLWAAENAQQFEESLDILHWNIKNSIGSESAFEIVMPYLVWMCQNSHDAEDIIRYCFVIGDLIGYVWNTKLDFGTQFLPTSFTSTLRSRVNMYDAVANHTEYFTSLLSSDNDEIRFVSFYVLRFLADEYLEILPHLIVCFDTTSNVWIKAITIWYYALFAWRDWHQKESSIQQLYHWMQSDNDLLRFIATLGWLHLHPVRSENRDVIPDIILNNLVDYFNTDMWAISPLPEREKFQKFVRGTLSFDKRIFNFVRGKPFFWLELLKRLELTPIEAHYHCRELLQSTFRPIYHPANISFWHTNQQIKVKAGEPIIYQHYEIQGDWNILNMIKFNHIQKAVLEFIVNCEPFWEHNTNLFSHYYRLPDERHRLRALL